MKLKALVLPLLVTEAANAIPLRSSGGTSTIPDPSEFMILEDLVTSSNGRLPISRRFHSFQQNNGLAKQDGTQQSAIKVWLALILGTISSYSWDPPVSRVADVQEEPSKWSNSKTNTFAKRKKIRYGPFRLPPISEKTIESYLLNQQGLVNALTWNAKKPLPTDHILLDVVAGLEFDDGTPAGPNDGAWLHHAVLTNVGLGVVDADCGTRFYDFIFENGNEKVPVSYANPNSTFKSGYRLRKQDTLVLNTEMMNMDEKEKWVWLTITYDYLEDIKQDYKESHVMWMSVGYPRCGSYNQINPYGASNLTASLQPLKDVLSEYSWPWEARSDGYMLGFNGHMHNGGTEIEVYHQNELICKSIPTYGKSAAGGHGGMRKRQIMGGNHTNTDIENIVGQTGCWFDPPKKFKKGDKLHIKSSFDFNAHPGTKMATGELDSIMGLIGGCITFD